MTDSSPGDADVPVRPASTVIWVRAAADGAPEVLLMKRHARSRFMPGAYVFAGGSVDGDDRASDAYALSHGMDDSAASALLKVPQDGLGFYVAAVRESFEECGLLLACDAAGTLIDLASWPETQLHRWRRDVGSGALGLVALCRKHAWQLALERLFYFGHWVTPANLPRRFDTRFFIACAPGGQVASLASEEMSDLIWRRPQHALTDHAHGRVLLMRATRAMLTEMAAFGDVDALFDYSRGPREIESVRPVLAVE